MKTILILLKREIFILRNRFFLFFITMFLTPIFLYLFITIPLSKIIENDLLVYEVWSAAGIWIVSTFISTYLYSLMQYKRNLSSESFLSIPILSWQLIFFNFSYSYIIGFLQLTISIILISTLTYDWMQFVDYVKLLIIVTPILIIISIISFFVDYLIKNKILLSFVSIFIFMIITFGYGSFIPIESYPDIYKNYISYLPTPGLILNSQNLIKGESLIFSLIFISFFVSLILSFIKLFILDKRSTKSI